VCWRAARLVRHRQHSSAVLSEWQDGSGAGCGGPAVWGSACAAGARRLGRCRSAGGEHAMSSIAPSSAGRPKRARSPVAASAPRVVSVPVVSRAVRGGRCAAGPEMEPGGDCGSHDRGAPEDSEQNPGGQDQDGVGGAEQGERAHHAAPQDAVNTHLRRIFLRGLPLRRWVVARR